MPRQIEKYSARAYIPKAHVLNPKQKADFSCLLFDEYEQGLIKHENKRIGIRKHRFNRPQFIVRIFTNK